MVAESRHDTHVLTGRGWWRGKVRKVCGIAVKVTKQKMQLTEEGQKVFAGDAASLM